MRSLDPSRRRFLTLAASTASLTALGLPATAAAARPGATDRDPDFGPNVFVYDPSTPTAEIQATLDRLFSSQFRNEMGGERYAVLFKPGRYEVDARLGYYTTVAGLGRHPDDVEIHGAVRVVGQPDPNSPAGISALTNFWRSAENLSISPTDWSNQWAVSQAAPMRRVHVKGILWLEPGNGGYSSGGFIADSKVDGITINGSQQQWLTRDSELGGDWTNGVWNQVFSGVLGAPAQGFPDPPYTTLPTSPVTREKPYLFVDAAGRWRVAVPGLRRDTAGTTWAGGAGTVRSLPLSDFYLARPTDSAKRINQELSRPGRHLLLTPGVYHLDRALRVKHPDTVVLGLGMPSLAPTTGDAALRVEDVPGVRIAGVLVDAGPVESAVLVEVGRAHGRRIPAGNPTSLHDVFFRIGGPWVGRARTSLVVNSDHTIVDNIWAWRGDHGNGIGWDANTAATGVVVNGDDVTAYGLFVEHYQRYQTVWNGERGRTIFYQSELPYDPPSQAAWSGPTGRGWASYRVADHVRQHEAWGLGVYSYFNQGVDIRCDRAIEVPRRAGVRLHDMITVFLDGSGGIERTVNDVGTPVVGSYGTSPVVSYP
ncbi:adenylyl cyclase [Micromonospora sp. PLK6-60]|uniref:adenylyl cyclase n=1 Tax=Micromonospora sp. PLK6-60 TaxID=2873383 RepID=UPI001CA6BD61|nr:adenylyl cyclase [Micromonospora sp. PLK6-60]MBY8871649.1 adenylyl cyclase [Micromonospora sp. PLK6-60]